MNDVRRRILEEVAQGVLSPQEAAALLQEVDAAGSPATTAVAVRPAEGEVAEVSIRCPAGKLTVIGDPTVKEAVAVGPHSMRREGDVLAITLDDPSGAGFSIVAGPGFRFSSVNRQLEVRMNPALRLRFDGQAASVVITGVTGPITGSVQAGATRIEGFEGPLNLSAQAGSIVASGRLSGGSSRITCEAGAVRLGLRKGSSVRIKASSTLGKVKLLGEQRRTEGWGIGSTQEAVVGGGEGSLEIVTSMGAVAVEEEV